VDKSQSKTFTPWGRPNTRRTVADGITFYSTPSHGGYGLSDARLDEMPACLKEQLWAGEGWFEEDCDWARVALAFPEYFPADAIDIARKTLAFHHPDILERFDAIPR